MERTTWKNNWPYYFYIYNTFLINVLKHVVVLPEEEFKTREAMSCGVKDADEIEEFDMKNDLLEYVQNMGAERDTVTEVQIKPDTNVVHANSPGNKLAAYGTEGTTDLNSFFDVQQKQACVFTEVPTGSKTQTAGVKTPEIVDKVSRESLYLSERSDNMVKAKTVDNTTWKYDNERVMNGGGIRGVSGYSDMDDGYASYYKSSKSCSVKL